MAKSAYQKGYETAKSYLMDGDKRGLHKHMMLMQDSEKYFEGITNAMYDHEHGLSWEF